MFKATFLKTVILVNALMISNKWPDRISEIEIRPTSIHLVRKIKLETIEILKRNKILIFFLNQELIIKLFLV